MSLSGERLLRALELFQEWCDLAAAEREARLVELAGTDPELEAGVRALLDEDQRAANAEGSDDLSLDKERLGRWLAETAAPDSGLETDVRRAMPERIGDYRVLGILGVGGMGVVYRAEQHSPRRAVAVKVVHPTSLSTERRKRLRQEAEILGRLEHPGIARIYSAGTDDFGAGPQPYFAMEFVEGRPLARYCEEVGASIPERVELVAQVCEGVDYAHRLGIVHRDLKPDNVLVQDDGLPRVLDFGVARSIEPGTDVTSLRTEDGRLVGTLSYMSPEQVEGVSEGLTPACDVYSLGSMLFEVLTGRTPYDLHGEGVLGALHLLQSKRPDRLGTVRRDLRGDLDRIVSKALQRDPERRYSSAGELGDDLRRHLRKEPILARRPSTLYELQRFVVRNPALVAGVTSTFVVLAAGIVIAAGLALRARQGEQSAKQENYVSTLRAIDADLRLGDSRRAAGQLARIPTDLRGWEWNHLNARIQGEFKVVVEGVDAGGPMEALDEARTRILFTRDGQPYVWDRSLGRPAPWGEFDGRVVCAGAPRGGRCLIGTDTGHIWSVSVSDPRDVRAVASLGAAPCSLAWDSDGAKALALTHDHLWRISEDGAQTSIATPSGSRTFLGFELDSQQRRVVLTHSRSPVKQRSFNFVTIVDLETGEEKWDSRKQSVGRAPAFDPSGERVFLASNWGAAQMLDVSTGQLEMLPGQAEGSTRVACWSQSGELLFTSNGGRHVEIRSGTDGEILRRAQIARPPTGDVSGGEDGENLAPRAPDSERPEAATHSEEWGARRNALWLSPAEVLIRSAGRLVIWDLNPVAVSRFDSSRYCYDVRFSPDGRWLLFREYRGSWVLVDALLGRSVARFPGWTYRAAFAADGASLLFHRDGWARVDLASLELLEYYPESPERPRALPEALLPWIEGREQLRLHPSLLHDIAGNRALRQGKVLSARSLNGGPTAEFEVASEVEVPNRGVAWNRSKGWIAAANGRVRIFDDQDGSLVKDLGDGSESTYSVAFDPRGTRLATGRSDGGIVIWETENWRPVLELRGHGFYVRALAFSSDGERLASASGDKTVKVWDSLTAVRRQAQAGEVRAKRDEVYEDVLALVDAGHSDLAARVRQAFPPGIRRDAAFSWVHELAHASPLPVTSESAASVKGELDREER